MCCVPQVLFFTMELEPSDNFWTMKRSDSCFIAMDSLEEDAENWDLPPASTGEFVNKQKEMLQAMLDGLPPQLMEVARRHMHSLLESGETEQLRIGTACSGTDITWTILRKLFDSSHFAAPNRETVELVHVFSAEKEPFKQTWIKGNFVPAFLYDDIKSVGAAMAIVGCTMQTSMCPRWTSSPWGRVASQPAV